MAGEIKNIEPTMSLQDVMNRIQLRFMDEQAQQMVSHLDALIERTEEVAPVRTAAYALTRKPEVRTFGCTGREKDRWQEKQWEDACYHAWSDNADGLSTPVPFRRIVSYQVMLRNTNADTGWGKVDLLGASAESLPVVIELKSKISEYLLRAIVEGVAYAVAIKKAWSQDKPHNLRVQWEERLALGHLAETLTAVAVVVAAPSACWARWKGDAGQEKSFRVQKEALEVIADLRTMLNRRGYPVSFVEVLGGKSADAHGLPTIEGARTVSIS